MRPLLAILALSVIAAATYTNVVYVGGLSAPSAPLTIALAGLLAFGFWAVANEWQTSPGLAVALGLCLFSGEAYWTLTNAEREIATRELAALPAVEAANERAEAERRLLAAETAKKAADDAMIAKAPEKSCLKNCADLLKTAQARANDELLAARLAVNELPSAQTSSPLPQRLGIAVWAWDLIMALLRSVAIAGASIAVAIALHRPGHVEAAEEPKRGPAENILSFREFRQVVKRKLSGATPRATR